MNLDPALLDIIVCPNCRGSLAVDDPDLGQDRLDRAAARARERLLRAVELLK